MLENVKINKFVCFCITNYYIIKVILDIIFIRGNMKRGYLFVFILLSLLTITGCKDSDKKLGTLSAPQEVMVQSDGNKSLIIFDEVENAQYYNIYINDMSITVKSSGSGTIQFDASKIMTSPQKYTIKVKAGSDDYFDSKFSQEYEYNHTNLLQAPILSIDGTTLNWTKVDNATFYDVIVTTSNPEFQTVHRFQVNKFNFANILVNKGEYLFKVQAVSENNEYLPSIYSNTESYTHEVALDTPSQLIAKYDLDSKEMLLSFVSSENVTNFTLNINGVDYIIDENELNKFLCADDLDNMYIVKLSSFIKSKNIIISNSQLLNVKVKANASEKYVKSSQFSNTISCQFTSVLATPTISVSSTSSVCTISINATPSTYLSGFAIYLNDKKYKTLSKDITEIELPLTEVGNSAIRVQAISNNNNCYSSKLSDAKYVEQSLNELDEISINFENGILSWSEVENSTSYYVEILNATYKYSNFVTTTSLDLANICEPNKYNVKVVAMADGYKQSESIKDIQYTIKLSMVENIEINSIADNSYLTFDAVDGCYGYVVYLNNVMINHLFVSNNINVTAYVMDAGGYNINIQAVDFVDSYILNSDLSAGQELQNIRTLSSPKLTISNPTSDGEYYLNVDVDESESAMALSYEVWINYVSIGEFTFQDRQIPVTSYFTNAGQYHFMIKAKAIDSAYIKDSNIASKTYSCVKQLDTVTDIIVTHIEEESKYILTFKEQTLAAKYIVTIVKTDDEAQSSEFELSTGVADITEYVRDNGVYKIYVKAIATAGGFYTDSATSGNPFRLTKGQSLPLVENITVEKRTGNTSNGEIDVTWSKVENCDGYQVYIYYTAQGQTVLKKSIYVAQSNNPTLNIGTGEYKCLNKEGFYTVSIKALGDGELYETSQLASIPYDYIMETIVDFERNTIFMYGNTYNYKIETIDDLKHLLWYHYLYNQDVWLYNTLEYNLKVYCSIDLDKLASEMSEDIASQVEALNSNVLKMNLIAKELLKQYPEIAHYSEGLLDENGQVLQAFCLNEAKNIYIFRYVDLLDNNKLKEIETNNQVYKEKLDIVDIFDQRSTNYVFSIETKETVDVTTTEQLYMAIQYNKKPNFVGDCEVAKAVYENAKFILRQICSDDMSEYEKTLQIYNFLTKRVAWNSFADGTIDEEIVLADGTYTKRGNLKDFYLEGILYNSNSVNGLFASIDEFANQTAVCDGLAKTFVVLCHIEGITCIKVNGTTTSGLHSWNKVYIDIEDDGNDGKQWYAVDLASAIQYSITVSKNTVQTSYQASLHKYFLISDATLNAQAISWSTPMGDGTDYKATIDYNYYENQRYSCEYNGETLVSNKNFKVKDDADVVNILINYMLKANKRHRIIGDIDAEAYITSIIGNSTDEASLATVTSRITNTIYETARTALGGQYNCYVTATIVENRYIILSVESVNYKE